MSIDIHLESESAASNADSDADHSVGGNDHSIDIELAGTVYHVTIDADQWSRLQTIIPPKPVPNELNAAQITADHIQAVQNVWQLLVNRELEAIDDHDSRKLHQSGEEHHLVEPHHWPLDGYDTSDGFLPLQYVSEAVCDYIATIFGRAFAGREFSWLGPTNRITAADVLTATVLDIIDAYGLGSIEPPLPRPTFNQTSATPTPDTQEEKR